jgi:type IV pilus assembly protein PilA
MWRRLSSVRFVARKVELRLHASDTAHMGTDAVNPRGDAGFSLIELLVVVLILGILAAIALPTFLSQRQKGNDGVSKHDVRALVSHVEACFAESGDYTQCDTQAELGSIGLPWGTGAGQVSVTAASPDTYTITGTSKGSAANQFSFQRLSSGLQSRTCTTGSSGNTGGGCYAGGW